MQHSQMLLLFIYLFMIFIYKIRYHFKYKKKKCLIYNMEKPQIFLTILLLLIEVVASLG